MRVDPSRLLPNKASLDQLRKQAKELKASDGHPTLSGAQHALALSYGFDNWAKLKLRVEQKTLRRLIQDGERGPVEKLLESNRQLAVLPFEVGDTPLHVAAEENRPEIVELLVQHGARTSAKYAKSAHSPLSWALTNWSFDAAHKLVELGVEPDLFCSAGLGDLERVKSFWIDGQLRAGASTTGSSRHNPDWTALPCPPETPREQAGDALYIACRAGRRDVAQFLIRQGTDPNFRAYIGGTPLHWAEFSGDEQLCQELRAAGGDDGLLDYAFRAPPKLFPIMVFAGWGFVRQLADRLTRDLDVIHVHTALGTPLHAAAAFGQEKCVQMLLLAGADPTRPNEAGKTALDLAQEKGHETIVRLLQEPQRILK